MSLRIFRATLEFSALLLRCVEVAENDTWIPSDKHPLCEQMRRADGFSWAGPISLGKQGKSLKQREVLRAAGVSQAAVNYLPQRRLSQSESG